MAKKNADNLFGLPSDTPDDQELFRKRPPAEPGADDIFTSFVASDPDYALAADMVTPSSVSPSLTVKGGRRWSQTQVMLLGAIVIVAGMLLYLLWGFPAPQDSRAVGTVDANERILAPAVPNVPVVAVAEPAVSSEPEPAQAALEPGLPKGDWASEGPVSLQVAERAYQGRELERAYALFETLLEGLAAGRDNDPLRAFFRMRMSFCLRGLGRLEAAQTIERQLLAEPYPLVQAIVRQHRCRDALRQGQRWVALQEGYHALGLADCLMRAESWSRTFKDQCRFLIGRALTEEALTHHDTETVWPPELWIDPVYQDPFDGADENTITEWIDQGSDLFRRSQVGPRVQRTPGDTTGQSWRVVCNGAPLEELLGKLASAALMDLDWSYSADDGREIVEELVRQRPVKLFLWDVSPQAVAVAAAGEAQLFVDLAQADVIRLLDPKPEQYGSLQQRQQRILQEALAHWQRIVLAGEDSPFLAHAHFATAVLLELNQKIHEAIGEYQLLANRFKGHRLAARALMRSSRLRAGLMDFDGARDDLRHLVELYPEADSKAEAFLELARVTQQAGLTAEAVTHYRKVYYTDDAPRSALAAAALGAGRCHRRRGELLEAARWFTRYIDVAVRDDHLNQAEGFLELGDVLLSLGKTSEAEDALSRALAGELTVAQSLQALKDLVDLKVRQSKPLEALDLLAQHAEDGWTREQANELASLKASVLFSMGLADQALTVLEERLSFLADARQRGRFYAQMARIYEAAGQASRALAFYADVLDTVEPGPLADEARLGLARLRLAAGQTEQAAGLLESLYAGAGEGGVRREARRLLVQAYRDLGQWDRAARLLLDRSWQDVPGPGDPNRTTAVESAAAASGGQPS